MVKTVLVTLDVDIPEAEMGKTATLSVGTNTYAGKVMAIVVHEQPVTAQLKIEAVGLKTVT